MVATLAREERLRLMKFVCSVAWADLEVPGDGNGSYLGGLQAVYTRDHAIGKIPRRRQVGQSL